jgi:hypothetical protein
MKRAIVSAILAIYVMTSTPQADAAIDPSKRDTEAQLRSMPVGTPVEIRVGEQPKVIGRIKEVTGQRLVLDQGIRTVEYSIDDVTFVQKHLLGGSDLELSPNALGVVVLNERVKAMTRDGGYVEGKVIQASEDSLVMDVCKSEPKGRFRGRSRIATADISVVYMKKSGGVAAPVGLGVLGGFLAMIGGTYAAIHTDSGPVGAFLIIGGTAGGAALGAYAGHELAKKSITINVIR